MEIQKTQRAAQLRLSVLLPIIISFSFAQALIVFSTKTFFDYHLNSENEAQTLRVQRSFEQHIAHDISNIGGLIQLIQNQEAIKSAWRKKDRQALIKATAKIYQAINASFDISHFYFHNPDGKNFLRVHRPGRFGDNIYRKTLLASRRSGKLSAGLEIGTFGQFVLRVVEPWVIDGQLIGYLELGEEITHITQDLKESTSTEIITLIDKGLINRDDWKKSFGSRFNWQRLDKWIIASSTLATIPTDLNLFPESLNRSEKSFHFTDNKEFIASQFTLTDFSGSSVGKMVVLQHTASHKAQLFKLLTKITVIGCAVILLLAIVYFIYLKKIENRLALANRKLHQKIGEHKQTEAVLRINRDELAAINRELESYSYSIAHDLRAPLRSVTSFSQIVLEDAKDKLSNDEKDNLNRVIAASVRMAELIDDILQLSRITREELSKKTVNLSKVIERTQHQLSSQDPGREVEWDIQPDVTVSADPRLIERAIENLINNAWKYTGHTDHAKITFGTLQKNNETIYFVRDNGAGFDMNYAHKLFTTFQRLHSPREFTGSGIGLAIVLRVIQRHHGRIWGEGEVGKGATFYFTLPDTSNTLS